MAADATAFDSKLFNSSTSPQNLVAAADAAAASAAATSMLDLAVAVATSSAALALCCYVHESSVHKWRGKSGRLARSSATLFAANS